jgi:hypothetical protein
VSSVNFSFLQLAITILIVEFGTVITIELGESHKKVKNIWFGMAWGEKLFEESGNITGFKVTKAHQ